jgi:demethylmenaquinone methyltransferase/2-methoxy-6-polyprenyl-1,4-benzoquinol methylase
MFDRISHRYDLLNHLLSFGRDFAWRRRAVGFLPKAADMVVLDLACGTADLALTAVKHRGNGIRVFGVDMSERMLRVGLTKVSRRGLADCVHLLRGDGMQLPLPDGKFDAAMIAFGIRNMSDPRLCLRELFRILRPGGRLVVLEFSIPENRLIRALYLPYFRYILPRLGGLVSGDTFAYSYLDRTVETFARGEEFEQLLREAGFERTLQQPLTFGVATIYVGDKIDL